MYMSSHVRWLIFILLLTAFCVWVALPPEAKGIDLNSPECKRVVQAGGILDSNGHIIDTGGVPCTESIVIGAVGQKPDFMVNIQQVLGLDLVGGLRVLLEAQIPTDQFTPDELRETANNVARRVDALGLTEATVQVQGSNRILVELPGVHDPQQAISTIQQTALLEFVDFTGVSPGSITGKILTTEQLRLQQSAAQQAAESTAQPSAESTAAAEATVQAAAESTAQPAAEATAEATAEPGSTSNAPTPEAPRILNPTTGQPFQTVLTGAALKAAVAQYTAPSQGSPPEWNIQFSLKDEYAQQFADYTAAHIGDPMAIVLDGEVLSSPIIRSRLEGGGTISGNFTQESAQRLALQLRAGALRIPLRIAGSEEVGATLGQDSVRLSINAGIIGVVVVLTFMLIYYRVPGVAADLALLVFIVINMASFKLIPVALTLPAIVGFLISVGSAVDGNILIFERIKEELRAGSDLDEALVAGFDRAWTSIRDSNLSTIIICGILFLFGQTPGASIVSGFAVTLGLGLVINLFTAVLVTRTFLHIIVGVIRGPLIAHKALLGV